MDLGNVIMLAWLRVERSVKVGAEVGSNGLEEQGFTALFHRKLRRRMEQTNGGD